VLEATDLSAFNSVLEGLVLFISSEIDGLFTQGSRPGRIFCQSVGGIFVMDSPGLSNGTYSIPDPTLTSNLCPYNLAMRTAQLPMAFKVGRFMLTLSSSS